MSVVIPSAIPIGTSNVTSPKELLSDSYFVSCLGGRVAGGRWRFLASPSGGPAKGVSQRSGLALTTCLACWDRKVNNEILFHVKTLKQATTTSYCLEMSFSGL